MTPSRHQQVSELSQPHRLLTALALLVGAIHIGLQSAQAQSAVPQPLIRQYETRLELETQARTAEQQGRKSEAWLLRTRLQRGDFQEGDRVVVALENSPKIDTVQVRAGKVVQFVGMADLSLEGVLRSELSDTLRHHLARYLKNPTVRTTPLIAISVLGNVGTPGYYYVGADMILRDVIMRAGVPRDADLDKVVVKRNGETIWKSADTRVALADGLSVDQLHLRAGDEVFVPQRRQGFNAQTVFSIVSATTGVVFLVLQFAR